MRKDDMIQLRVNSADKELIRNAAEARNVSVSDFMVSAALANIHGQESFRRENVALRDWLAATALNGLLANGGDFTNKSIVAVVAYEYADAMLEARK